MRLLIPVCLLLAPAVIIQSTNPFHFHQPKIAHNGGRGHVNPPVVAQLEQINCLATMIYGEARGESRLGQVAVAHTALNRAKTKSVCNIVLAPKQYSIFNNNPALRQAALSLQVEPLQRNVIDKKSWKKAWIIAHNTYLGITPDPTKGATHYVADKVMKIKNYRYPRWTKQFEQVAVIENHRFFITNKPNKSIDTAKNL